MGNIKQVQYQALDDMAAAGRAEVEHTRQIDPQAVVMGMIARSGDQARFADAGFATQHQDMTHATFLTGLHKTLDLALFQTPSDEGSGLVGLFGDV